MNFRVTLAPALSFEAGYVDTAGFLALQGLFTAHVTGNFVTLGAALALGTSGVIAKILALPVFILVVALVRAFGSASSHAIIIAKIGALIAFAIMAWRFGPFPNADHPLAIATGMVGVAAMAIQNAMQRIHLTPLPPTTLMTGNTTQIVIDFVDLALARAEPAATARLARNFQSLAAFAAGCAVGAALLRYLGMLAFVAPPVIALYALAALQAPQTAVPSLPSPRR